MKLSWPQSVTDGGGRKEESSTLTLSENIERTRTAGFIRLQMASEGSSWVSTPSLHINGSCCAAHYCWDDFISFKETYSAHLSWHIVTCKENINKYAGFWRVFAHCILHTILQHNLLYYTIWYNGVLRYKLYIKITFLSQTCIDWFFLASWGQRIQAATTRLTETLNVRLLWLVTEYFYRVVLLFIAKSIV